jgi:hypothetical protein
MQGSRHNDEQRRKAAHAYMVTGSAKEAAAAAGVSERTARHWCQPRGRLQHPNFAELCREAVDRLVPEHLRVGMKLLRALNDRLDKGDVSTRDLIALLRFFHPPERWRR